MHELKGCRSMKLFRELTVAALALKKFSLFFDLKAAAAHAVCNNLTTIVTFVRPLFSCYCLPAAFAFVILSFARAYKITSCTFLYKFVAARVSK